MKTHLTIDDAVSYIGKHFPAQSVSRKDLLLGMISGRVPNTRFGVRRTIHKDVLNAILVRNALRGGG